MTTETRGTKVPQLGAGDYWSCPRMWHGETVFVVGNGASLRFFDPARLARRRVIAVNSAVRAVRSFFNVLFFGDAKWYWLNRLLVNSLMSAGHPCVSLSRYWVDDDGWRREQPLGPEIGVRIMRQAGVKGLAKSPDALCWNRSSGGAAVDLAVHLGAARVVLVGYDMQPGEHAEHVEGEKLVSDTSDMEHMAGIGLWTQIMQAADARGIELVNATENSALPIVPCIKMEEVL